MRQISSIIFCQIDKIDAGILTYFKEILAKMTENLPEDGVQSRQAVAQRCCLNYEPILIPANISAPEPKRQTPLATNNGMDREAASSPSI